MKKSLISADTVRQAHAQGLRSLPAGLNVMVTAEAREVAAKLRITLDAQANAEPPSTASLSTTSPSPASLCPGGTKSADQECHAAAKSVPQDDLSQIRAAVLAQLPAAAAANPELVEQIVNKVRAAQSGPAVGPAGAGHGGGNEARRADAGTTPIKLVKSSEVKLGVFPGAGADKQVGIADVITACDGSPIAAGFMAWSKASFPWTLDYDEIDLVLEGELHIRCGGQTLIGRSGDVLYIPKGSRIEFGTPTAVRFFYVTYPANWQA